MSHEIDADSKVPGSESLQTFLVSLMEELRKVQVTNRELASLNLKMHTDQWIILDENRKLKIALENVNKEREHEITLMELGQDLSEKIELLAIGQKQLHQSLVSNSDIEKIALKEEMHEIILHLHSMDKQIDSIESSRNTVVRIESLERNIRDLTAQLNDVKDERASLFRQLELSREKIKMRDAYGDASKMLTSLTEIINRLTESGTTKLGELSPSPEGVMDQSPEGAELSPSPEGVMDQSPEGALDLLDRVVTIRACGLFDEIWYMAKYGDRLSENQDPVEHYTTEGYKIGLLPSIHFDSSRYARENPDVAASGMDPLYHYIKFGKSEGRARWPYSLDVNY
jgi:hypothetical protein